MWRSNTNFKKLSQTIYIKTIASNKNKIELQTYAFYKDIKIIEKKPTEIISHELVNITVLSNDKILRNNTVHQSNMGYQLDFRNDFGDIDKYLSKSELKYININRITSRGHYQYEIFKQIGRTYKYRDILEILQNLGSYQMMRSVVHDHLDMRKLTFNYIKENKQWLKRGLNMVNIEDLEFVKTYYRLNDVTLDRLKHDSTFVSRIKQAIKMETQLRIKPRKLLRYLDKQNKPAHYYQDYLNMMRELNLDTDHWTKQFPKDLVGAHDRALQAVNEIKEMEKTKELEYLEVQYSKFKEMLKKLEFEDREFSVKVPETINSIRLEGETLQHCVSNKSYLKNHANLESIILFIRKTHHIEEPYFTLQINNKGEIVQLHGFGNENTTEQGRIADKEKPKVKEFVNDVLKENDYISNFINVTKQCRNITREGINL